MTMPRCAHLRRTLLQLTRTLLTLLYDSMRFLGLCLASKPHLGWQKTFFFANSWRCIKSATSNRNERRVQPVSSGECTMRAAARHVTARVLRLYDSTEAQTTYDVC